VGLTPHKTTAEGAKLFTKYQLGTRLGHMTKPLKKAVAAVTVAAAAAQAVGVTVTQAEQELEVEEDTDRDFYSIAGLLMSMELRNEDEADEFEL
jgi:hypothetical protein